MPSSCTGPCDRLAWPTWIDHVDVYVRNTGENIYCIENMVGSFFQSLDDSCQVSLCGMCAAFHTTHTAMTLITYIHIQNIGQSYMSAHHHQTMPLTESMLIWISWASKPSLTWPTYSKTSTARNPPNTSMPADSGRLKMNCEPENQRRAQQALLHQVQIKLGVLALWLVCRCETPIKTFARASASEFLVFHHSIICWVLQHV